MAYIDKEYYDSTFHGKTIPDDEFDRLAEIASDLAYEACIRKPTEEDVQTAEFKKAVCYQTEFLYLQGGIDAIAGMSEATQSGGSEHLGDYSITGGSNTGNGNLSVSSYNGIPVSSMMIALLKRAGLMNRWVYAEFYGQR